ncbi:hypothetical protein CY35_13G024400 [Sphagnum magellanicum]|nr:hypothetical protein CY35_13G024400 [Sphagnum magellanicum]
MQAAQRKKKKKKQKVKVGSVISVYWPEDKTWYHGEVISFNDDDASEICEVLYEDGEREVIKLKEEKYKIGNKARDQKLCRLLADGDVNAQLTSIREILYDIEDRLPCKGVSSDRPAWWQAWHVGIDSAVEARSILLLVPFVEKLARILRPNIKTNWWKIQGEQEWFKRLGSVKSSADLYVLVNDLLTKGVDWTEARQFFPICNTQYEVKQGLWDERRQSKRGAKTSQKTKGQLYVKKVSHMNMDNSDKVDQGGIKGQNMKVGMEKAGPDISEPQRKSIQHRRRKMVIRAGKDFGMEEKRSADAAQLLELERHSSDKENSDKSEQRSSGGSFVDKLNPSARHRREGRSELLSYRTRSKRKADEVKVSEGQKSARTEEGLLSRLRQGLLRVGASRIRSQKEQSNEDESSEASSDEEATPSSSSEGSDENTSADPSEDGEDSCFQRGLKKKTMARKTRAIIGKNGRRSQSPAPSDEEVCSVCKFAGAGEMMLLCDGLKCDEAFHSFCLAIPLQTIPDGDWLCPMCIHQGSMAAGTSKLRKKKLSSESIPPTKKIEAILGMREAPSESVCLTSSKGRNLQYLIKWSSLSHRHDTWVPEDWLLHFDRQRLLSYQRRVTSQYGAEFTDERRPEWLKIDRIIACRKQDTNAGTPSAIKGKATEVSDDDRSPLEYLVKWCNLDYNGSTWEEESSDQDMLDAIQKFSERHLIAKKRELSEQTGRDVAIGILQQPVYIKGGFLHEYQIEGLKWLVANFEEQKSVILADEMGLGKTIQAISFMMCLRHEKLSSKPFLVIAPKSTLPGWEQELQQWGADLNAVVYEGDQTARALIREYEFYTADEAPLFDVLVTSYDLSMRDNSCLQRFEWSCIIVDEGHRVKNMRSKLGSLLKKQTADFRLLLTGTPVQNTLTELFALLHFLDPSEFPDPEQSAQEFAQVDAQGGVVFKDKGGMEQQVSRIHELLQPRMLRRLKREVMRDMIPGKKLVEVRCALTPLQHHLYGAILKKNYKQLNHGNRTGKKRSLNTILMDLKMVCNHPYLFPGKEPDHCGTADEVFNLLVGASGKLQLLQKLLPKLKEEGHRVLLFSQMTRMLDILEDFLSHLGYSFSRIDGSTSAADRQKQISEFNSPQSQDFIFLISTRAGGLGINLPSADTVIIYGKRKFNTYSGYQIVDRKQRLEPSFVDI